MTEFAEVALAAPIFIAAGLAAIAAFAPGRIGAGLGALGAAAAFGVYAWLAVTTFGDQPASMDFWGAPTLGVTGGLRLDGLSIVFTLLIAGIGAFVLLYAQEYAGADHRLNRLAALLLIFMAAMFGTVTANDVITLFVFWELTSLASFFLVGFDHEKPAARKAALQALLITGGGGLALLGGLILVAIAAGTTSLSGIIAAKDQVLTHPASGAAMGLILAGCFAKSAQAPLHFWLPNAMAAPTPVSAYLHSATMVKLGVYLIARMNPVFEDAPAWGPVLTWFGIVTAAGAALIALRETDLKRVLAYTTVTALGTLVMLIGIGGPYALTAAMTFLVVHALYKASLFLVAGIVDKKTGARDATVLGGLGRAMPLTAAAALLAALSMAGLPPFVGFVAKELIYAAKLDAPFGAEILAGVGFFVNAAMVAIAGVFSWRLFFGPVRETPKAPRDPHPALLAGPAVLAALGLVLGAAPGLIGDALIAPATAAIGAPESVALKLWPGFNEVLALSAATIVVGVGLFLAWSRISAALGGLRRLDAVAPASLYDRGLAGFAALCDAVTARVQNGDLRFYLRWVWATTAAALLATLWLRDGFAMTPVALGDLDARALAFVGLVVGGVAAALARTVFLAVVASGVSGVSAAMIFLFFGAPDVAFTQFAVETLLVALLAAALLRLPLQCVDTRSGGQKFLDALVAVSVGGAVTAALLAATAGPFDPRVSAYFGAQSMPAGYGANVVNVILVDFRALDTLGEIAVLAIAALAAVALLARHPTEPAR